MAKGGKRGHYFVYTAGIGPGHCRTPAHRVFMTPKASAQALLTVQNLQVGSVGPISTSREGEVFGLVRLAGRANQIGRAICGIEASEAGSVSLAGNSVNLHARTTIDNGIAFVSSNREAESLGMSLLVRENFYLNPATHGRSTLSPLQRNTEKAQANQLVQRFSVRPPDGERVVSTLSGGNQQKVVLGRWLSTDAQLFVLEELDPGRDVGAKAEITP
jgi:ribose transport system ATP-binding protein